METPDRGLFATSMGETQYLEKSPFIQGFIAAIKGAVLGAGSGATVQLMRGKSPAIGAIVGGLGTGLAAGLIRAAAQKSENIAQEEGMRYHINQMKNREPLLFMPPPSMFGKIFHKYHEGEHAY